jgi:ABC-2 type transport system ATP-binding protein
VAQPIISVADAGICFSSGKRHRSAREFLFRGGRGNHVNEFWALRDISFEVQPGESIGVVGANGQGKSTLLKLIAGVLLPDLGQVEVRGGVAPLIEITGGFVGDLTVRENIRLTAGLHGMTKRQIDAAFDQIVDFADIDRFLDAPYRHLSSGMKVRVAFSVVSRLEEPVLLVDEVLAVGDAAFRRKCYARIEEMVSRGTTLFVVSHNEADLRRFCSRGIYLDKGGLVFDGPMEEALDRYRFDSGAEG